MRGYPFLFGRGSAHPRALYDESTVAAVKAAIATAERCPSGVRIKNGLPQQIADEHGVGINLVRDLCSANRALPRWRHL